MEGWSVNRATAEYRTSTEFVGGRVRLGDLTDGTEQPLRLARNLVECGEFVPDDVVRRFVEWFEGDAVGMRTGLPGSHADR